MPSVAQKRCEGCGKRFAKPLNCSVRRWSERRFCSQPCKVEAQVGAPSKKRGNRYRDSAERLPCRICGQPTRYLGTRRNHLFGLVHCGSANCRQASLALKNERIAKRHLADYASGKRKKIRTAWLSVARISVEERAISSWFELRGWTPQFRLLLGVSDVRQPRSLDLDFAQPALRLCVEIDGTSHRKRKDIDARRDELLAKRGWKTLRIPASLVRSDIHAATGKIAAWINHETIDVKK